jgi:hypothetical protein
VENRINTCQKRLEWYRAHNVFGIVNGEPGWIYDAEVEFFEDQLEELQQELVEAEADDSLDQLYQEMHKYEQTKFNKRVLVRLAEAFLWAPVLIVLWHYAGYYTANIGAITICLLIVRYVWNEIRVFKRD